MYHESDQSVAEYKWSVRKGNTPTPNTGPSKDHDTNSANGYYLYLEASEVSVRESFCMICKSSHVTALHLS